MSIAGQLTPRQRRIVMVGSLTATSMVSLDITIANVALPEIQGGLAIAPDQLGWILTSYMIASAIGTPLVGALVPKLGLRTLYILSVAGFSLASLTCGLSTSLAELVFFRAVQGFAGAALIPLSQTLIYDIYPREQIGRAMGTFSVFSLMGAVIGPSIGGFITGVASWRWIYLINVPVGIATVAVFVVFMPKFARAPARPFDYLGFTLLAIALFSLQLFLDRGQSEKWFESGEIIAELSIAVAALYMFVVHSLTAAHPFIDLTLFKDRNFVAGTIVNAGLGLVSFLPMVIAPLFLQHVQGYDPLQTGLLLTSRGVGMMTSMIILSRVAERFDPRILVSAGSLAMAWGFIGLSHLTVDSPASLLIWTSLVQSVGMSLTMLPLNLVSFATLSASLRPMGASLYMLARGTAMSCGTALALSYAARSTENNHVRLLEHISVYNPAMSGPGMEAWSMTDPLALKLLSLEVWRQASVIAFDNVFTVAGFIMLAIIPALLLIRITRQPAKAPEAEAIEAVHVEAF
jgi:DHA2 family multidrug resistance protein